MDTALEITLGKVRALERTTEALSRAVLNASTGSGGGTVDPSHTHPATAITYAGSTTLSATTVEAALDELGSEKFATTGGTVTGTISLVDAGITRRNSGDTHDRMALSSQGLFFGPGNNAAEVGISRLSTGVLTLQAGNVLRTDTDPTNVQDVVRKGWADTQLALKAPLASPTFTGTVSAPTVAVSANNSQVATTASVASALGSYITISGASSTYATISNLNLKAPIASPTFTGTVSAPTVAVSTNNTQVATTAAVSTALGSYLTISGASSTYATIANLNLKSPIASPTFSGTVNAPTVAITSNNTQVATTAAVTTALSGLRMHDLALPTASTAMNGQVLTGLGAGTANGHSLRYEQLFSNNALQLLGQIRMPSGTYIGIGTMSGTNDASFYQAGVASFFKNGDSQNRVDISVTDGLRFGSGSTPPDVQLSRLEANVLQLAAGDSMRVQQDASHANDVVRKSQMDAAIAAIPTGGGSAASVSYAGSANLSAANVEDALDELDAEKASLSANQTLGGTWTFTTSPVVPTPAALDSSTKVANTAWVGSLVSGVVSTNLANYLPLTGGTLTGNLTASTSGTDVNVRATHTPSGRTGYLGSDAVGPYLQLHDWLLQHSGTGTAKLASGHKIQQNAAPTVGDDLVNKTALDSAIAGVSGGSGGYDGIAAFDPAILYGDVTVRESMPLIMCNGSASPTSSSLQGTLVGLRAGDVITHLSFAIATAANSPTQWWFALYDLNGVLVRQTAAQGSTATGTGLKKLPLTSSYTVPTDSGYYVVFYQVATTTAQLLRTTASVTVTTRSVLQGFGSAPRPQNGFTAGVATIATAPSSLLNLNGTNTSIWWCAASSA